MIYPNECKVFSNVLTLIRMFWAFQTSVHALCDLWSKLCCHCMIISCWNQIYYYIRQNLDNRKHLCISVRTEIHMYTKNICHDKAIASCSLRDRDSRPKEGPWACRAGASLARACPTNPQCGGQPGAAESRLPNESVVMRQVKWGKWVSKSGSGSVSVTVTKSDTAQW